MHIISEVIIATEINITHSWYNDRAVVGDFKFNILDLKNITVLYTLVTQKYQHIQLSYTMQEKLNLMK